MDEQLRSLARRAGVEPSVEVEAALLRERVRVGELSESKVRLAAWLGHAAARACLGEDSRVPEEDSAWLEALERLEPRMSLRACLEAVRVVVEAYDRARHEVPDRSAVEGLTASRSDLLACPCDWHRTAHMLRIPLSGIGAVPTPDYAWLASSLASEDRDCVQIWERAVTRLRELASSSPPAGLRELVGARLADRVLAEDRVPADAAAAALHARLRAGELTIEQLRVAAALDHAPAGVVLGLDPRRLPPAFELSVYDMGAVGNALQAGGRTAHEIASRVAKRAAGIREDAPGVGSQPIPDSDALAWFRAVSVGWGVLLPAVRDALLRWALGAAKNEEKEQ